MRKRSPAPWPSSRGTRSIGWPPREYLAANVAETVCRIVTGYRSLIAAEISLAGLVPRQADEDSGPLALLLARTDPQAAGTGRGAARPGQFGPGRHRDSRIIRTAICIPASPCGPSGARASPAFR